MTPDKVLSVIELYREKFQAEGIGKIDFPHGEDPLLNQEVLAHCHGMLDKMVEFVREGRMDKVFRWLGFVQGCLWTSHRYTLDELMNHNRP